MDYLSDYLVAMRAVHGKTQQYMADLIGIDQSSYSRIERGLKELTFTQLTLIARHFGMEVTHFIETAKKFPLKSTDQLP